MKDIAECGNKWEVFPPEYVAFIKSGYDLRSDAPLED